MHLYYSGEHFGAVLFPSLYTNAPDGPDHLPSSAPKTRSSPTLGITLDLGQKRSIHLGPVYTRLQSKATREMELVP